MWCGVGLRVGGLGEGIKYIGFHVMGRDLVGFFIFGPDIFHPRVNGYEENVHMSRTR